MPAGRIRDSHPLWRPVPRNLDRPLPRSILYKLQLGLAPDFKFELLPLHSPLLGQSLLVSFPPLIDMLKFSGYPYLIRGQSWEVFIDGAVDPSPLAELYSAITLRSGSSGRRTLGSGSPPGPNTKPGLIGEMTLERACPSEYQRAQCAFKDSMIHWILQFTLLIAFRCVLHRCQNQEIRCWKFLTIYFITKNDTFWQILGGLWRALARSHDWPPAVRRRARQSNKR